MAEAMPFLFYPFICGDKARKLVGDANVLPPFAAALVIKRGYIHCRKPARIPGKQSAPVSVRSYISYNGVFPYSSPLFFTKHGRFICYLLRYSTRILSSEHFRLVRLLQL